jgi:hypothetical protein
MSEMTSPRDERAPLEGAKEEFVDRLAEVYAPEPMTAGERVAFEAAIRDRLARPRRRPVLIPAIGAAAAAALLWWVGSQSVDSVPAPAGEKFAAVPAGSWEDELFLSSDLSASEDRDESRTLPDEYLAIANAFLGG